MARHTAMTLNQKIRLVALYGDISDFNRDRWFKFEALDYTKGTAGLIAQMSGVMGMLNDDRVLRRKQGDENAK